MELSFWQYKVYADIRGGSLESGVIENDDFPFIHLLYYILCILQTFVMHSRSGAE